MNDDKNKVEHIKKVQKNIKKSKFRATMIMVFSIVLITILMTFFVRTFVFSVVHISGSGMEPTISQNESFLIYKFNKNFQKNDIITFYVDDQNKNAIVSRVIAVGGDSVYIDFDKGNVYVNNILLDEPYIKENTVVVGKYIAELIKNQKYGTESPIILDDSEVFVMGDNRNNSRDSREFGPISVSQIFGLVKNKIR